MSIDAKGVILKNTKYYTNKRSIDAKGAILKNTKYYSIKRSIEEKAPRGHINEVNDLNRYRQISIFM